MAETELEKPDFDKIMLLFQEANKRSDEFEKQLKEVSKQIGGLGNKFGSYNEALFIPSIIKLLETKFDCKKTFPNARFRDNGNIFEIDLLGISDDACYLVEIKSYLKQEGIVQLENLIEQFSTFEKGYAEKKKFGMITATEYSEHTKQKAIDSGFYFISIIDEIAKLAVPAGFVPKEW